MRAIETEAPTLGYKPALPGERAVGVGCEQKRLQRRPQVTNLRYWTETAGA